MLLTREDFERVWERWMADAVHQPHHATALDLLAVEDGFDPDEARKWLGSVATRYAEQCVRMNGGPHPELAGVILAAGMWEAFSVGFRAGKEVAGD